MIKTGLVALLVLTVVGAGGVAIYENMRPEEAQALKAAPEAPPVVEPAAAVEAPVDSQAIVAEPAAAAPAQLGPSVGELWTVGGMLVNLDDFGFEIAPDDGSAPIYVELGPPTYWQAQGVTLQAGEHVNVQGFAQDGMYHAAVVKTSAGATLMVRDGLTGQPLWSGGAVNGQAGNASEQQAGAGQGQAQVSPEDWVTVQGTVMAVAQNSLTVQFQDQTQVTLQLGRSGFAAEQGVVFAVGDQVKVIGYDQLGQFRAGEIENLTQGGRLMLLDPNGRPLWAGPGTSGQSGQGGNGAAGGAGTRGAGQGGNGAASGAAGAQGGQGGYGAAGGAAVTGTQGAQGGQSTQGTGRGWRGGRSQ